jgi:hypothetical protein
MSIWTLWTVDYQLTKLGLGDDEHLLDLLLLLFLLTVLSTSHGLGDELGERVGQSTVLNGSEVFNGRSGGSESLDGLDLEAEDE